MVLGYRSCVGGNCHTSKMHNEEERDTIVGLEATFLAPWHTIYSPHRPIAPEVWHHVHTLHMFHCTAVAPLSDMFQEGSPDLSLFRLTKLHLPLAHLVGTTVAWRFHTKYSSDVIFCRCRLVPVNRRGKKPRQQ